MKVYIAHSNIQYERMYKDNGWRVVGTPLEADIVQFTGGADVSPSLYGQEVHPTTSFDPKRDRAETALFMYCQELDIPMVGICRGAQFLNVMSGGSMRQHVDGHATGHQHIMVDVTSGEMLSVTSTHHQMMDPSEEAEVLAVASESTFYEYMDDGIVRVPSVRGGDTEVVWYPDTQCLCFQPHPEYLEKESACQQYFFDLITYYI